MTENIVPLVNDKYKLILRGSERVRCFLKCFVFQRRVSLLDIIDNGIVELGNLVLIVASVEGNLIQA